MADILVRDVAPNLKRDIESRAREANRSLSDEIKYLLRAGLEHVQSGGRRPPGKPMGQALIEAFSDVRMTEDEHKEFSRVLEEHRREQPRPLPDFE